MSGTFTVFFATDQAFRETIGGEMLPFDGNYEQMVQFTKDELKESKYTPLDTIYERTQNIDKAWNLYKPCRSMSMGDLIRDDDTQEIWMVDRMGFTPYIDPSKKGKE